jgi:hypothetical protein
LAQKVNIVLLDDIDESDADETVSFALDGKEYAIDLSADNATKLREALATFVAHARPVSGRGRRAGGSSSRAASSSGPSPAEIRSWARENGFEVPERGRVSAEVRDAYAAAH